MAQEKTSAAQILFPVVLLSVSFTIFLGFQTWILSQDRSTLQKAKTEQTATLEQVEKVKNQASALALGTLHLSQQGNKNAEAIIAQLKQLGINVADQAAPGPTAVSPGGTGTPGENAMQPDTRAGAAPTSPPPK